MADQVRIVGLGGSLRENSATLAALHAALAGAAAAGAHTELFDVRAMDLPMYNPGTEEVPAEAHRFSKAACEAQGMIWSSPLYHGTVSGAFKNALDWLQLLADQDPPYLANKVIGLISVAGGVQGLQAVNTMEFATRALRAWAVPMVMPVPRAWQIFGEDGQINDTRVEEQLHALGREVVRAARQFAGEGTCDYMV
jgi:FMN reductase